MMKNELLTEIKARERVELFANDGSLDAFIKGVSDDSARFGRYGSYNRYLYVERLLLELRKHNIQ